MKQTDHTTGQLRCKNCGGSYDASERTCPFCGEDTFMNTDSSSGGLLDETKYGGGFGADSSLSRLMKIFLGVLAGILVVWCVGMGVSAMLQRQPDPPASSNVSSGGLSGGASSSSLPADPDASQAPVEPSVTEPEPPDLSVATALILSASELTLEEDGSQQLTATVAPEGWTGSVLWSSSDPSVASVDSAGKVTYVSGGSCTITAEAGELTQTCTVQCEEPEPEPVSDLDLYYTYQGQRYTHITLNDPGDGFVLEVTGGTGTYEWSTSNAAVATVTDSGSVYAVGTGTCTITVTSGGASKSVTVRVK